jgi:enoyl-CoA hydratase/2-(1,2-epoxy-1,2-dihydrophenyl)acetyl-CoA isomerase
MTFKDITYQKNGPVVIVRFNRPEKLNAVRRQGREELRKALQLYGEDDELRAMILTGAGQTFSAGADLNEVLEENQMSFDEKRERTTLDTYQDITRELIALDKPVIAAVNGFAVGVGLEVALACDLVIASQDARFIFPEAQRGLFQTNGIMFILPRLVGFRRAMDILMTGRTVDADEALSMGMINYRVAPDELMTKALDLATICAQNAPISMSWLKRVGWSALETNIDEVMDLEVEGMLSCLQSDDLKEGLQAFLEKRKPIFKGE